MIAAALRVLDVPQSGPILAKGADVAQSLYYLPTDRIVIYMHEAQLAKYKEYVKVPKVPFHGNIDPKDTWMGLTRNPNMVWKTK